MPVISAHYTKGTNIALFNTFTINSHRITKELTGDVL